MPQTERRVIRVVSTNVNAGDNPINKNYMDSRSIQLPFLVTPNGPITLKEDQQNNFNNHWDLIVIRDQKYTGLPDNLENIREPVEVLWLVHDDAPTKEQRPELETLFGFSSNLSSSIKLITFHHDDSGYRRYLDKVVALCECDSNQEDYGEKLKVLDHELRAEGVESDICDILWLLACGFTAQEQDMYDAAENKMEELKKNLDDASKGQIGKVWEESIEEAWNNNNGFREAFTALKNAFKNCLAGQQGSVLNRET